MAKRPKIIAARKGTTDSSALFEQALALHRQGQLDAADAIYRRILASNPKHADAMHLSGMVAYNAGRLDEAANLIESAIKLEPGADIYLGNLGNIYRAKGDPDKAITCYRRAIVANDSNPLPYSNLGNVQFDQGLLPEAIASFEKALSLRPDFYETLFNLGLARRGAGDMGGSLDALQRAIRAQPERAEAHYTYGQTLLLLGRYAEAWPEYDWRWRLGEYAWLKNIHGEFTQPRWRGEDLAGKTLLVYAEQGMGDSIHFCRYLPELARRGARVIFAVHPRLRRLMSQLPGIELVALDSVPLPAFDYHSPLLGIPERLDIVSVEAIPPTTAYLQPEAERVQVWAQRLAKFDGLRIGIAWQGNPNAKIDRGRSPPLAAFAPLAAVPGVRLISLQQIDGLEQLKQLPAGMRVDTLGTDVDLDGAFVDTAAIMANLDLIVVSDSAIAHLAGALGRPVWVPVKKIPDWRFLLEREDTPWYPNMRLFRQSTDGEWREPFARIAAAVAERLGAAAPVGADVDAIAVPPAPTSAISPVAGDAAMPAVPQSWGEIIDKISILDIKSERLSDPAKLANVRREFGELTAVRERHFPRHDALAEVYGRLKKVNEALWQIEDDIRDCERARDFGTRFIELARAVYVTNDLRAELKREINELLGSTLKEEKSYKPYAEDQAAAAQAAQQAAADAPAAAAVPPAPNLAVAGRDFSRLASQLDAVAALPRWTLDAAMDRGIAQQMLERLRAEGVLRADCRVLDVSCGDGETLAWCAARGAHAQGLGLPAAVTACQARGLVATLGDDTLLGCPLPAASVDLLWSHQSLQRSLMPYHTLLEYRRLLAAGAYLYIDVPVPDTVMNHQAVGTNFSAYGQGMWRELFLRAGFTEVWGVELGMPVGQWRDAVWAFLLRRA